MRYMIIVKATGDSEAGVMPEEALLAQMQKYHEDLMNSGALLDGSGLKPSARGWRIRYAGDERTVVDGPFAETKELIAGYTIIQAKSREAALELTRRFPNPAGEGKAAEIEVREFYELEDFAQGEAIERFREMDAKRLAEDRSKGAKPVDPVPHGMHGVTPHLICAGAAEAIEFYKKAFDATEEARLPGPQGKLMHAMIRIAGSPVMLVDEFPEWGALGPRALKGSPVTIHLFVADVDAFVAKAVAAGAKITMPIADMFWGDRYGKIEDPFGHQWSVATHLRDMTLEEIQRAMQTMGS